MKGSPLDLPRYIELLDEFVAGAMSAQEFETAYIKVFGGHGILPKQVEETLNELFYAVDDYVGDPELRARAGGLDDDQLLAQAKTSLAQLRELYRQAEIGN